MLSVNLHNVISVQIDKHQTEFTNFVTLLVKDNRGVETEITLFSKDEKVLEFVKEELCNRES